MRLKVLCLLFALATSISLKNIIYLFWTKVTITIKFSLLFLICFMDVSTAQKPIKLFNGKDLKNWEIVLKENTTGSPVFYVDKEVLNSSGNPYGYIRTKKSYDNFELTLEWRWPIEPLNSGVLLFISGKDEVWPHCIEAQLMDQNAGDLMLMHTGAKARANNVEYEIKEDDKWVTQIKKQNYQAEKKTGEWNKYKIRSENGTLEIYVNDVLQNTITDFKPNKGYIGLQSEGSHIQFRNILIKKL